MCQGFCSLVFYVLIVLRDVTAMTEAERIHLIHDELQIDVLVNMDGYSNSGIVSFISVLVNE